MVRLRRSDLDTPGITRRRCGRGFSYRAPEGGNLTDSGELERIKALAIPPAWAKVWISPHAHGHIQAVGTDGAGRRQYIYHPRWRARKDREKFDRALAFAATLPGARRVVTRHLRGKGTSRERALAAALRIVDAAALRIGSAHYAQENGTFGVTTLQHEHLSVRGTVVAFDFPGKSGQRWNSTLDDGDLAAALRPMLRRSTSGAALAYRSSNGLWQALDAPTLNEFLRQVTGGDFTAKDFRTWQATVLAAMELARANAEATTRTARKRALSHTMQVVAEHLGNTPAVVRKSYVDPRLADRFMAGDVIPIAGYSASEKAVQEFLAD